MKKELFEYFSELEKKWERQYTATVKFYKENSRWPSRHSSDGEEKSMGLWCREQKRLWRSGVLRRDRQSKLTEAGFDFSRETQERS